MNKSKLIRTLLARGKVRLARRVLIAEDKEWLRLVDEAFRDYEDEESVSIFTPPPIPKHLLEKKKTPNTNVLQEVASALHNLGFKNHEIDLTIEELTGDQGTFQELIVKALRMLRPRRAEMKLTKIASELLEKNKTELALEVLNLAGDVVNKQASVWFPALESAINEAEMELEGDEEEFGFSIPGDYEKIGIVYEDGNFRVYHPWEGSNLSNRPETKILRQIEQILPELKSALQGGGSSRDIYEEVKKLRLLIQKANNVSGL